MDNKKSIKEARIKTAFALLFGLIISLSLCIGFLLYQDYQKDTELFNGCVFKAGEKLFNGDEIRAYAEIERTKKEGVNTNSMIVVADCVYTHTDGRYREIRRKFQNSLLKRDLEPSEIYAVLSEYEGQTPVTRVK